MTKYKMRYTINGIQQEKMIKYNLDPYDTLLLDTLKGMYSSPSFENLIEGGKRYIWVNQTFLLDYIPVFGSRSKLQARLKKLEELGFIHRIVKNEKNGIKGTYSYMAFLPKFDELTEYETYTEPKIEPEKEEVKEEVKEEAPEEKEGCFNLGQGCPEKEQGVSYNNTGGVLKNYNKDTHYIYTHYIDTLSVSLGQTGQTDFTETELLEIHEIALKDMAYEILERTDGFTFLRKEDVNLLKTGIESILKDSCSDRVYDRLLNSNPDSYSYALQRYNEALMAGTIINRPAYWKKILKNSIDEYVYETIDDRVQRDLYHS